MTDLKQRADYLERRYHELYRETRAARSELRAANGDDDQRWSLQTWLDATEHEMKSILREMDRIEDSLIDDTLYVPGSV